MAGGNRTNPAQRVILTTDSDSDITNSEPWKTCPNSCPCRRLPCTSCYLSQGTTFMVMPSCGRLFATRKESTGWVPALCTTICRNLFSGSGCRNWESVQAMMIPDGGTTVSRLWDAAYWLLKLHGSQMLSEKRACVFSNPDLGGPDAPIFVLSPTALASSILS